MTTRDYNFKNKISICPDCCKKIFYNNMKHECIKYEPCSLELQDIADELDDENNRNKTGIYLCNGVRYNLTRQFEPIQKYIPSDFVYESKYEPPPHKKSYEKFLCSCGVFINEHTQDNHERTARHKKRIKQLNKC
jgi:hypothetical protein